MSATAGRQEVGAVRLTGRVRVAGAALAAAGCVAGPVVPLAPPAAAAEEFACEGLRSDQPPDMAESTSRTFGALRIQQAWDILARRGLAVPGRGINVAVLSSGVVGGGVRVIPGTTATGNSGQDDWTGTAMAGLIAGSTRTSGKAVGVAPGAGVIDVKVYDAPAPDEGMAPPNTANLAAGLTWVAESARARRIEVAVVGVGVPGSPALRAVVRRLQRLDVLVIAASGGRPVEEDDPLFADFGGDPQPGEDAADAVFPAGYPGVLGVNATAEGSGEDATGLVLANSATDLAAPTFGAVSASVTGGTCVVQVVNSFLAAAQVAGVAALLRQAFPGDNARQIAARLTETATGTPSSVSRFTGHGIVQPVEALSRKLAPASDGTVSPVVADDSDRVAATAPRPPVDPLADLKGELVWIGLFGAAALALAVLLRALARR